MLAKTSLKVRHIAQNFGAGCWAYWKISSILAEHRGYSPWSAGKRRLESNVKLMLARDIPAENIAYYIGTPPDELPKIMAEIKAGQDWWYLYLLLIATNFCSLPRWLWYNCFGRFLTFLRMCFRRNFPYIGAWHFAVRLFLLAQSVDFIPRLSVYS